MSAATAPADAGPVLTIDERACLRGGVMAGQYLDEIGKSDLATLTREEWSMFCQKLVGFAFMFAAQPPPNEGPPL